MKGLMDAITNASMGASDWVADQTTQADLYSPEDVAMMLEISNQQKKRSMSPLDMASYGASMSGKAAKQSMKSENAPEPPMSKEQMVADENSAGLFDIPEDEPIEKVYSQGGVQPAIATADVPAGGEMQPQPIEDMPFQDAAGQLSGMGKKELKSLQEGLDLQLGAAEKIGQLQYQKGQAQAQAQQGYVDKVTEIEQQKADREADFALDAERQMMKISDLNSQIEKFELKDYWADKSTGQKIGLSIAMAMGAYASAITGGPNAAMQVIDNAIKRDMDLQKTKIGKLETVRNAAQRQYQQLRENFVTAQAADDAAMSIAYNKAAMQVGQVSARYTGQEAIAKAQALQGQLIERSEQYKMKAANEAAKARFQMGKDLLDMQKGQAELSLKQEQLATEKGKKFVAQLNAFGVDPVRSKELGDAISEYDQASDIMGTLEKAAQSGTLSKLSPTERAGVSTALDLLAGKLRIAVTGPGAFTKEEREMLKGAIGDPNKIFQFDSALLNKLKQVRGFLESNVSAEAKKTMGNKGVLLVKDYFAKSKKDQLKNLRNRKKLGLMKVSR